MTVRGAAGLFHIRASLQSIVGIVAEQRLQPCRSGDVLELPKSMTSKIQIMSQNSTSADRIDLKVQMF